ncbi:molybdopterin-dependent oxidoreductase [Chloroflexota bacterium]
MQPEKIIRTVCSPNCMQTCSLLATVRDGKVVKVAPAPLPDPEYGHRICLKGLTHVESLYSPSRLTHPMKRAGQRGEGKWERITWEDALDTIAGNFREIKDKFGSRYVGVLAGTGNAALLNGQIAMPHKFCSLFGATKYTVPIDLAVRAGILAVLGGVGGCTNEALDWVNARNIIVWGGSIGETRIQDIRFVFDAMENGAKLVVIDPRFTTIASKANMWVPLKPGSDIALALGMINVILNDGLFDKEFVLKRTVAPFLVSKDTKFFLREKDSGEGSSGERYMIWDRQTNCARLYDEPDISPELTGTYIVNGIECSTAFELLTEVAGEYSPEEVARLTEVPADIIRTLAVDFATRTPGGIIAGFGPDRYYEGITLGHAMATLLALTGNLGKSGTIHSSLSYFAALPINPSWQCPTGNRPLEVSLTRLYDMDSKEAYPLKALYVMCHNTLNQLPNRRKWLDEILPKLELFVVADRVLTTTAEYADIVLPAAHWFETEDIVRSSSMPYLLYRNKVVEPMGESKPDFEIWKGLAQRLGLGQYFEGTAEAQIRQFLDAPNYQAQGITFEKLKEVGAARLRPKPDIAYQAFSTASGRVEFYVEKWADRGRELPRHRWPIEAGPDNPLAVRYPLILISTHGRWRVHSQFVDMPWLSELNPEAACEINPSDARTRGIKESDLVEAFNDRGKVILRARLSETIRPGMVYIEQGWWPKHYTEGHHQELTHEIVNPVLDNFNFFDIRVEVRKAG